MTKQGYCVRPSDERKLGLRRRYVFRKGKSVVEGDSKKVEVGLKQKESGIRTGRTEN